LTLFVADKIEPGREGPDVENLRELARKDLRRCAYAALEDSISHNEERGRPIHPKSLETLEWLEDCGEGGM
ncbi:MAG: nicotinate-nucleotide adenylyltransferase, partial [Actinomycetota bacterium]|nr:nicotinate-nucleotide adenylyltransferase [Actinomycetota bacterium]